MTIYWCESALLGDRVAAHVTVEVERGRIARLEPATRPPSGATTLPGLVIPGLANVHSHAFHRVLRGRTQGGGGDFWSWREAMYAVATKLDPDSYHRLATAVYAEMALAGVAGVGEFHYLHHQPGGRPYGDPNAMGDALVAAAAAAGIRITLLDTCYLAAGFGVPPTGAQLRFSDGTAGAWAARASARGSAPHLRHGAAVHSVRAVDGPAIATVAAHATRHDLPLHAHLSEQPAENEAAVAATGLTPTELLAEHGALTPATTVVHATHLAPGDIAALGAAPVNVCLCPTTERDLADGIGPAADLAAAGCRLTVGSDSHAVVDIFEEARAVELDQRLRSRRRGTFSPADLLTAATSAGMQALGWGDAGAIAPGQRADLVAVDLGSVRTAGVADPIAAAVFAATAADVTDVVVDGRRVVSDRAHLLVPDVPGALAAAIAAVSS